jgi:hypothetical protein
VTDQQAADTTAVLTANGSIPAGATLTLNELYDNSFVAQAYENLDEEPADAELVPEALASEPVEQTPEAAAAVAAFG